MKTLFRFATLLTLMAVAAMAQDCQFTSTFTAATAGTAIQNTSTPCVAWRVTYSAVGMSALSIQIEGAPYNAGGTAAGTFAAIPSSSIVQGTNPLTNATNGTLAVDGTVYYPFIRINVTVFTPTGATGTITARTYGYKGTSAAVQSGGALTNPMNALGDMIYATGGGTPHRLPGNTTTSMNVLTDTGDGTNAAAEVWSRDINLNTLAIGATPATTGGIRLPTGTAGAINARKFDNTGNITMFFMNNSDQIEVGSDLIPASDLAYASGGASNRWTAVYANLVSLGSAPAGTGGVRLSNNQFAIARNAAGAADLSVIGLDASDHIAIDLGNTGTTWGNTGSMIALPTAIAAPFAVTVTQGGTPGATAYKYKVAYITQVGTGDASGETGTATGNAVLSVTNYNIITPSACPHNATGYIVIRTVDPNGNIGTLPTTGACGATVHDIYTGKLNAVSVYAIPLPNTSAGYYTPNFTGQYSRIGDSLYSLSYVASAYGATLAASNSVLAQGNSLEAAISGTSEATANPIGFIGGAFVHDAGSSAIGAYVTAGHIGTPDNTGPVYGSLAQLVTDGNGNVPGWTAGYAMGFQTSLGTGRFADVAAFDCPAASFATPGTGDNACLHSLQAAVGGSTIYFLLEEGGLPSKLAGSLTVTPLKSTTGQVFVCATTTGQLVRSAIACVGTI